MAENFNRSTLDDQNEDLVAKISLIQSKSKELKEAISLEKTLESNTNHSHAEKNLTVSEFNRFDEINNLSNLTLSTREVVASNEQLLKNLTQINMEILKDQLNVRIYFSLERNTKPE